MYAEELISNLSGILINVEVHEYPLYAAITSLSVYYHLVSLSVILNHNLLSSIGAVASTPTKPAQLLKLLGEWCVESARPVNECEVYELNNGKCEEESGEVDVGGTSLKRLI